MVAFLEECISSEEKYGLYNYVDTPDMTMNELVSKVRFGLRGKKGVGIRIPYWLGKFLGYIADSVSRLSGKNLPVSSLRVKKFTTSTEFKSAKNTLNGFKAPYSLHDGITRTLQSEFITPDPSREIFYTE